MTALPHERATRALGVSDRAAEAARARRAAARAARRSATAPRQHRTTMQVVAGMRTRTFIVIVGVLLTATFVAVLALNTLLTQGSFARYELMTRDAELVVTEQALVSEVAAKEDPGKLARAAYDMGMVPNVSPVFIDARTGQVFGTPVPAPAVSQPRTPEATTTPTTPGTVGTTGPGGGGEVPLGLRSAAVPQ